MKRTSPLTRLLCAGKMVGAPPNQRTSWGPINLRGEDIEDNGAMQPFHEALAVIVAVLRQVDEKQSYPVSALVELLADIWWHKLREHSGTYPRSLDSETVIKHLLEDVLQGAGVVRTDGERFQVHPESLNEVCVWTFGQEDQDTLFATYTR